MRIHFETFIKILDTAEYLKINYLKLTKLKCKQGKNGDKNKIELELLTKIK